jgi:hypothetical protein
MKTVTVRWTKHFEDDFNNFRDANATKYGVYVLNDAVYEGAEWYRSHLVNKEFIYVGMAGGQFNKNGQPRSVKESKTVSKKNSTYKSASFGARYMDSYTAVISAFGGARNMCTDDGSLVRRPVYFGEVVEEDRCFIKAIESQVYCLYLNKEATYGYKVQNKDQSNIALPNDVTIKHTGDLPFLLLSSQEETILSY